MDLDSQPAVEILSFTQQRAERKKQIPEGNMDENDVNKKQWKEKDVPTRFKY